MSEAEAPVLSKEEVDALLKGGQEKTVDLSALTQGQKNSASNPATAALANVMDGVRLEWEKIISSFLRKKISITIKSTTISSVDEVFKADETKYVYTLFRLQPQYHGVCMISLPFLHNTIDLLYGGKIIQGESQIEIAGKVGVIVAERMAALLLAGYEQGCSEYGVVNYEIVKSTIFANLLTNLSLDEQVYVLDCDSIMDDSPCPFKFIVLAEFLKSFFPQQKVGNHKEKDFWRHAINSQVSDSQVNVCVTLQDLTVKMQEMMALKEGDLIPISDPTSAYVCLNNLKLFRAAAGQANNKLIAKIINQI